MITGGKSGIFTGDFPSAIPGGSVTIQGGQSPTGANPGSIILAASGGKVGIGTSTPAHTLDVKGDIHASGAITGSSKNFRIDDPLDPEHKYLYHASIESSEMKNMYDGVALLDSHGEAEVILPEWFEALNQDFRYQLTAVDAPGPNLYVKEKIQNNRFRIAGGQPGAEVSRQVTGVRHDAWAKAHPLQVEEEKPPAELMQ